MRVKRTALLVVCLIPAWVAHGAYVASTRAMYSDTNGLLGSVCIDDASRMAGMISMGYEVPECLHLATWQPTAGLSDLGPPLMPPFPAPYQGPANWGPGVTRSVALPGSNYMIVGAVDGATIELGPRPFAYISGEGGGWYNLARPTGFNQVDWGSCAFSCNSSGVIVGQVQNVDHMYQNDACVWNSPTSAPTNLQPALTSLFGEYYQQGEACAIGEDGTIVGDVWGVGYRPFWKRANGTVEALPTTGYNGTEFGGGAYAVRSNSTGGTILGLLFDDDEVLHAVTWNYDSNGVSDPAEIGDVGSPLVLDARSVSAQINGAGNFVMLGCYFYKDCRTTGATWHCKGTGATSLNDSGEMAVPIPYGVSVPAAKVELAILGDANGDRHVNFADYLALESGYGHTNATWQQGDFNEDGTVGFADYLILEAQYGHTYTPEPSTMLMIALGWFVACRRKAG